MRLKSLTAKLADYHGRLESGSAKEIKPGHVRKVLEKLQAKQAELSSDLTETVDPDKRHRLERKLRIAREQIDRAEWLLGQID